MMIMFCTAGVSQTGKCWLRLYFEYICLVLQRTGNVEGKNLSDYSDCVTILPYNELYGKKANGCRKT